MKLGETLFLSCFLAASFKLYPAEATPEQTAELARAAENGDLKTVEALIQAKANVNARIPAGATILMLAVKHPQVVKALIDAGANVNAENFKAGTALMYAVEQRIFESVNLLIAAGAMINHVSTEGVTPLLIAANAADHDMTDLLLAAGAEVDLAGPNGVTALSYAAGNRYENAEKTAQNLKTIRLLIKRGANINTIDEGGDTPLTNAAKICAEPNVAVLLEYDVHVDLKSVAGKSALDLVCTIPDVNLWDKKLRERIRAKLLAKAAQPGKGQLVAGVHIGKVFSVNGKNIEITGSGLIQLRRGSKVIIKNSAGNIAATVTETLHTKAKAQLYGKGSAAAGDAVHLSK